MQTETQSQSPTPAATPGATPAPPATFVYVGADGKTQALPIPRTRDEVRAIRAQREQISSQLENIAGRRSGLARQLSATPSAAQPGLEARIALLDKRILQLETDLATTGQQLALASGELVTSTPATRVRVVDNFDEGVMVGGFSVFAFMVIVFTVMRRRWKQRMARRPADELGDEASRRLERLENGMDAIAIEIERVSEGQRFVTKLLSDSHNQRVPHPLAAQSGDPAAR